jgi:hypothetical protein
MNESEGSSAVATALSIIRKVAYFTDENQTRPLFVRLAWFSVGAMLILASLRTGPFGVQVKPRLDGE